MSNQFWPRQPMSAYALHGNKTYLAVFGGSETIFPNLRGRIKGLALFYRYKAVEIEPAVEPPAPALGITPGNQPGFAVGAV